MNTIVYERYMIENKVSYVLGRYYVGIIQKTKNRRPYFLKCVHWYQHYRSLSKAYVSAGTL